MRQPVNDTGRRWRWLRALGAGLLGVHLLVATAGAGQDDEKERIAERRPEPKQQPEPVSDDTSPPASKDDTEAEVRTILETLEQSMSRIRTVETEFTQTKILRLFKKPVVLKGRIYLVFPDKLAWHVTEPLRYSLVLDKDTLRQWDEDTDKVQRVSLASNPTFKTVSQQLKSWFSGEYTQLAKEYVIKVEAKEPELRLGFSPREGSLAGKAVRRVSVTFAEDRAYIRSIRFEDTTGDVSTLEFSGTKLDHEIPESAWQLGRSDD